MSDTYYDKSYSRSTTEGADSLHVRKRRGTDWLDIEMITNGTGNGSICIRSKDMAEHLHFMLGQLLRGE